MKVRKSQTFSLRGLGLEKIKKRFSPDSIAAEELLLNSLKKRHLTGENCSL